MQTQAQYCHTVTQILAQQQREQKPRKTAELGMCHLLTFGHLTPDFADQL
jgi:hypothetical protein